MPGDGIAIPPLPFTAQTALRRLALLALIDEATGFEAKREHGALQAEAIRLIVQAKHTPWVKRFPDQFFINLYRVYEIPGDPLGPRPGYVAQLINFTVYGRMQGHDITPGFDEVNPAVAGRRTRKNHQHMTRAGLAALMLHVQIVTNLLGSSRSRYDFEDTLRRAFPTNHEQLDLGLSYIVRALADEGDDPDG